MSQNQLMHTPLPPDDFGSNLNQYLTQYTNFADAKIAALVTADVAVLVILLPDTPHTLWLLVLSGFAIMCFIISALCGLIAFFPRTKPKRNEGVVFWRDILGHGDANSYAAYLQIHVDQQQVEYDYAETNFHISRSLQTKNKGIRISIVSFAIGLGVALIILVIKFFFPGV